MTIPGRVGCLFLSLGLFVGCSAESLAQNKSIASFYTKALDEIAKVAKKNISPRETLFVDNIDSFRSVDRQFTELLAEKLESENFRLVDNFGDYDLQIKGVIKALPPHKPPKQLVFVISFSFSDDRKLIGNSGNAIRLNIPVSTVAEREAAGRFSESGDWGRKPSAPSDSQINPNQPVVSTVLIKDVKSEYAAKPSKDSPYSVQIVMRENPVPLKVMPLRDKTLNQTLNCVLCENLPKGKPFQVQCINNSKYMAAFTLALDGIPHDLFYGTGISIDPKRDYDFKMLSSQAGCYFLVDAGETETFDGWMISDTHVQDFVNGNSDKSVAGFMGKSESIGTISVRVSAAWKKGGPKVPNEPGNDGLVAITPGQLTVSPSERVDDVEVGKTRSIIRIRYKN